MIALTLEAEDILARMEAQERLACKGWVDGFYALVATQPGLLHPIHEAVRRWPPSKGRTPAVFGALVRKALQEAS